VPTVRVPSVWPGGSTVSITGQVVAGDGHVVNGVAGLGLFGTPKLNLRKAAGGVSTAQAFGAVTIKTVTPKPAGGVGSAQAFGSLILKTVVSRQVTGLGSAQSFGTVTPKATFTVSVSGRGTAQAFGTPTFGGTGKIVATGIGTAQSFGSLTARSVFKLAPVGLGSAQGFGTLTPLPGPVTVQVPGFSPGGPGFSLGAIPGLAGWYDASQLTLADGALVNPWPDLSGNGRHLESRPANVAGSPPSCKTNGLNGMRVVHYTTNGDNVLTNFSAGGGAYGHFFLVAKFAANAFPDYNGLLGAIDQYLLIGTAGSTVWYPPGGGGTGLEYRKDGVLDPGLSAPMQQWAHLSLCRDQQYTSFSLQIGLDRIYPPRYWHGDVAEIVAYDHKLSAVERQQVENYLYSKWFGVGAPAGSQFGTIKLLVTVPLGGGVSSAASIGTPVVKSVFRVPVAGVNTAQQFGISLPIPRITVPVNGVPSARAFGAAKAGASVRVPGVPPGGIYVPIVVGPFVTGRPGVICGASIFTQFGAPYVYTKIFLDLGVGVPSAQRFGAVTPVPGPVWVTVGGVESAQQFGQSIVYVVYLRPPSCTDVDVTPFTCTDLGLLTLACSEITLTAAAPTTLDLAAGAADDLDLVPVEVG